MDEKENSEPMDFEAMQEKRSDELTELLDKRDMKQLQRRMEEMNEFDVAEFLTQIEDNRMPMVFRLLSKETAADVFANFEAPEQERIINSITDSELAGIIEELYVDDAVDMMEEMPANVVKRIMRAATPGTRSLINQYLRYPENSAGSIMTSEFVDLKKYMNVRESIARIRRIGEDKETIYVCFVISADRKLEGIVTVKDLLLNDDDTTIEDLMDRNVIFASTTEDQESVSEKFSDYDLMALPVVDTEGRLVGIVTVDDIIDVMEQETTEDFEIMAGILPSDKPYSRTEPIDMWKNRIPWLMFLMLSATFTSMILTSIVTVKDLLLNDDDTTIEDLMDRNVIFASTTEDQESVSEKFSDYDLMALPVVDTEGRLVGIVTVDDIIDVMEQETTEDFEIMAGILPSDKPYSRTEPIDMWKNRIPWLMFLMLSATFTSMILTSFEQMLAVQAGLVAFIPMLMGTGGNSGAQASTAVIRSLSIGDSEPKDALRVIWKEWRVALLCGLSLAVVNFGKMLLVDSMLLHNANVTVLVAATVSLSIVFIVMFAKVVGAMLPLIAEKIGVDPAVMANPLISTVTDAVSLLIYIYIAKLILNI